MYYQVEEKECFYKHFVAFELELVSNLENRDLFDDLKSFLR